MLVVFAVLFSALQSCVSYKFLAWSPQMANSHVYFMGAVTDVLVDAGHEVVSETFFLNFETQKNSRVAGDAVADHGHDGRHAGHAASARHNGTQTSVISSSLV